MLETLLHLLASNTELACGFLLCAVGAAIVLGAK
jgi:hypothetical protein